MDVMVAPSVLGLRHAIVTTASLALGHFADPPWRSSGAASFDDGFDWIRGYVGLSDKVSARRGVLPMVRAAIQTAVVGRPRVRKRDDRSEPDR
jgi:hypothetical protein